MDPFVRSLILPCHRLWPIACSGLDAKYTRDARVSFLEDRGLACRAIVPVIEDSSVHASSGRNQTCWRRRWRFRALLLQPVACPASYSSLAVYKAYDYTTTPRRHRAGDALRSRYALRVSEFSARSDDRLTLQGWWIEQEHEAPAVVLVHGRYQNRTSMLNLA